MDFEQINPVTFETSFYSIDNMGKVVVEAIRFFNSTFFALVKDVNCDWDNHKITFILRSDNYQRREIDSILMGTRNLVHWTGKDYVITWTKTDIAKSYHKETSEEKLRELYKEDLFPHLTDFERGEYQIREIKED